LGALNNLASKLQYCYSERIASTRGAMILGTPPLESNPDIFLPGATLVIADLEHK
jgi:hypothetical protein